MLFRSEVCYYQAIEFAIQHGLKKVEAGAQGAHKVARGYLPEATYSAHWIGDAGFRDAVERYGTSMTGSRLLNGSTKLHERLEELLAAFFGKEACLTFTTGYQANLGAIAALASRNVAVLVDKADHASIYDGCKLSDGEMIRFLQIGRAHV